MLCTTCWLFVVSGGHLRTKFTNRTISSGSRVFGDDSPVGSEDQLTCRIFWTFMCETAGKTYCQQWRRQLWGTGARAPSTVSAPWHNFHLCPSSQQILATPLVIRDAKVFSCWEENRSNPHQGLCPSILMGLQPQTHHEQFLDAPRLTTISRYSTNIMYCKTSSKRLVSNRRPDSQNTVLYAWSPYIHTKLCFETFYTLLNVLIRLCYRFYSTMTR